MFLGISIDVNPVQPSNAELPIVVTSSPITISFIEGSPLNHDSILFVCKLTEDMLLQPSKAFSRIDVTLLGIVTEVRPSQFWKAPYPIVVMLLGILIDVNPLQPLNAKLLIDLMLLDMDKEVNPLHPSKT